MSHIAIKTLFFISFVLTTELASAETFSGRVIGISDGDTLTVLNNATPVKIRISAIDAPESRQAFGQQAKLALSSICFNHTANVRAVDTDVYGRTVADVSCSNVDVGTWMVTNGYAWVYDKYSSGHSMLYQYQYEAKNAKRGLWLDQHPEAPWTWRRKDSACGRAQTLTKMV